MKTRRERRGQRRTHLRATVAGARRDMRARGTKLLAVNTEAALMTDAITLCSHSSRGPEASSQGRGRQETRASTWDCKAKGV